MAANKQYIIEAHVRQDIGKGASRRLRREEKIPGVIYGGGKPALSLTLEHKKIAQALENESFYSKILTLKTNSESERVILKDLQRHPYKAKILHIDFQRVRADEKLTMNIPLHFIGAAQAPGLKEPGSLISHLENDVEITCLPDDLPEYLEVNITEMTLNQILHLSDIKVPKGVELVALAHGDDKPIVSIHIPRIEEEVIPTEAPSASEVPAMAQKAEGEEPPKEGEEK